MQKASWVDKKTNLEMLDTIGEKRSLLETVMKRKKNWIGHAVRGDGLFKQILEGRMDRKSLRGRPRFGMIDDLKEGSHVKMKRRAEDRVAWRCWMPGDA